MEKLWYKAVMIFAFSMTVVAAGYFLTGLNDQLAQQVQSGAVDNMSGGSDFPSKSNAELFGGGGGAGITITPIAFIVVNNGEVSIKHISTEEGSIERTIGMIPDVVNSVTDVVNKFVDGKGKKTEENLEGLY